MARNVPEHARRGRINAPGCVWDTTHCDDELAELKSADRGAWAQMRALIEESQEFGLPLDTHGDGYDAPVGDAVKASEFRGRPVPWLGELRVEERTPKRRSALGNAAYHRLYFGEPTEPDDLVIGLLLATKRGRDLKAIRKQTRSMVEAMWRLIHWCEKCTPATGWREWDQPV